MPFENEVVSVEKLAICSRSYEQTISKGMMTFVDFLNEVQSYGIRAIDVLASHVQNLKEAESYHDLVNQRGMQVVNYSTRLTAISIINGEEHTLETFEDEFSKASCMGSPYIGIRTNNGGELASEDLIMQSILAGYKKLIELARDYKLKIIIENVKGVSSDPQAIEYIISQLKGCVHVCLDIGNFHPSHRYSSNIRLIPLAAHCHFKTLSFTEEGLESTIDTGLCMMQLIKGGYSGFIAIEYEGGGDEYAGTKKSVTLSRRLLHELTTSKAINYLAKYTKQEVIQ